MATISPFGKTPLMSVPSDVQLSPGGLVQTRLRLGPAALDRGRILEHLELFTGLQFDIDHSAKEIIARDTSSDMKAMPVVNLENVVDELSVTLSVSTDSDSGSCDYLGARNLGYEEGNHSMSPFYSCDWFIYDENFRYWTADTINDMLVKWDRTLFTLGDNPIFNGGYGNIRYPNIDDDPKRFYLRHASARR